MSHVIVRYWAAARTATGVDEEKVDAGTAGEAVQTAARAHPALTPVLRVATLLVDGRRADPDTPVTLGSVVEVLPPFAGG